MFALKVILKTCQITDVTNEYVDKVIVGDYGEQIMKYCLKVGFNHLKDSMVDFQYEHPDVLSNNLCFVEGEENKFLIHLKKFINEKKELFLLEQDGSVRQTRNTVSVEEEIDTMFQVVEDFISKFWIQMKERFQLKDLSAGPTSFSETPAESVFSVWERMSGCRPSLTLGHTVSLVRVAMEGPAVSTKDSLNLSKRALDNWPTNLGERYTTKKWKPGVISKTIAKIQNQ